MRFLFFVLFFITKMCCVAQVYQWGSSERYRKEDSLFLEWQKSFPKTKDENELTKIMSTITDSMLKIQKERGISESKMKPPGENLYLDSVVNSVRLNRSYLIEELKEKMAADTTVRKIIKKKQIVNEPGSQ